MCHGHASLQGMASQNPGIRSLPGKRPRQHCCVWQGSEAGTSSERTRSAITAALRKKLKDLMGDFQDLRHRLQVCSPQLVRASKSLPEEFGNLLRCLQLLEGL